MANAPVPDALFEAMALRPWPGALEPGGRLVFEALLDGLPSEVRDALMSALADPDRSGWSRAALLGLSVAQRTGARAVGLATDELIELEDGRGERFALCPLGFSVPEAPWGDQASLDKLLAGLDQTFSHRRYVLYLRRPVPERLDVAPILKAVALWLAQVDRGDREELHAVYEDDDVSIDLTVADRRNPGLRGGRILTVGPMATLDQLGAVKASLLASALRAEESLGGFPLVVAFTADAAWRPSRGFLQLLLFGTPDCIVAGGEDPYEASFPPRALFADPACQAIASLWWLLPSGSAENPLDCDGRTYDNPWVTTPLALEVAGPRFVSAGPPDGARKVTMRWRGSKPRRAP